MHQKQKSLAIEAIKKKLIGKKLSYEEIFALMDEISKKRLGDVLTTYFAAAGFTEGFDNKELFHLTKAMVETGAKLKFPGIVADKHSTGGVAGTRTTMILVPIIAAAGITIPKNSSRAITAPSGTADTMEVLAPVSFTLKQIKQIVTKVGGCIVWGGPLGLAPADDILIAVEEPLAFESYDKLIVSIMAKKVATGATHAVLDIPVGPNMKIKHLKDAELIQKKFQYLGKIFKMKLAIDIHETRQPAGRGVGPVLEVRDVFSVLEQRSNRPLQLEQKALRLTTKLLDLCFIDMKNGYKPGMGEMVAKEMLVSGKALNKMREIINAQGGDAQCGWETLALSHIKFDVASPKSGRVIGLNNHEVSVIARILGSPHDKKAGIYLERKLEDEVDRNDILCTFYSSDKWRLKEAITTLKNLPIYRIE